MKRILLIAALVLIIACTKLPPEQPPQTNVSVSPPVVVNVSETVQRNPCENINCAGNEECREGTCFCRPNFRQCGSSCIPVEKCCSDSDCKEQENCKNSVCVKTNFCDYSMKYDAVRKTCACNEGTKYCFDQQKCIKSDSCCDVADCNPTGERERICTPTKHRSELCLSLGTTIHCKKAVVGERSTFSFQLQDYDIFVQRLYEGGVADIVVKKMGSSINLTSVAINDPIYLMNITLVNKGADITGGNCKST